MTDSDHDLAIEPFTPASFDGRALDLLSRYPPGVFTEQLHQSVELMHRYTLELSAEILDGLGVGCHLQSALTARELCSLSSLEPSFCGTLAWLLEEGRTLGWLQVEDGVTSDAQQRRYRTVSSRCAADLTSLRTLGLTIDPGNEATLNLLDHAASIYPALARGTLNAEQALLAPEHIDLWLAYFDNANPTYAINNWTAAYSALWRLSGRDTVRVLEIGAGASSGSAALLHVLKEHRPATTIECYTVTEPSPFFLRRAQRQLRARHRDLCFEFRALDIDLSWESQGIPRGSFDLVYGVNVMHVARDLQFSLSEARLTLSDGGWLVLGECLQSPSRTPILPELVFQPLQAPVECDVEFRPRAGFLAVREWIAALRRFGFRSATVEPDVERITEVCPHFLAGAVCGQKPPRDWHGS
jgi:SAM-dependent methyltransferase